MQNPVKVDIYVRKLYSFVYFDFFQYTWGEQGICWESLYVNHVNNC